MCSSCAAIAGAWNSTALIAVTIHKNEFFVSTAHLPQANMSKP
jgi:hypothetical protein